MALYLARKNGAVLRNSIVVSVTAIALALVPSAFGADSIAWGSAVNGLRLGAAFGSDPVRPTVRVLFQNVGSATQEVCIGHESGSPIYDGVKFIATAPDGTTKEGFHRSVFVPIAGVVPIPLSVSLKAGESHELAFPLKDIIYASRTTITLEALMKQGYSVRVRFEVKQVAADWAKLSHPWIGTLTSVEISPAR